MIWGKYDLSLDIPEPEGYKRDIPNPEVHLLDAAHFAFDIEADEIAVLMKTSK